MKSSLLVRTLLLTPLLLSAAPASGHQSELIEALKMCAEMTDTVSRAACYEELGTRLVSSEIEAPLTEDTEPPQATSAAVIPDGFGGGEFADKAGVKAESYRGTVTSCQKSADRKWFYIFENNQVWKQVDRRSRRHRECKFTVSISKDAFGYIMRIDGQDGKIRVSRHR